MKWWIISMLSCFLLFPLASQAQEPSDSLSSDSIDARLKRAEQRILRYEHRLERYEKFWNSLIPDFARIQYAGSVGLINAGLGWSYGKRDQWETDLMFGYLPKYDTENVKLTFTIRQSFIPWKCRLSDDWSISPLSCGLFVNTVFSDKFWTHEPSRYPGSYYRFSSRIRFHIFLGQRFTFHIEPSRRLLARSISFTYELSTCDLYMLSAVTNKYVGINDILSLSLGLKYDF